MLLGDCLHHHLPLGPFKDTSVCCCNAAEVSHGRCCDQPERASEFDLPGVQFNFDIVSPVTDVLSYGILLFFVEVGQQEKADGRHLDIVKPCFQI